MKKNPLGNLPIDKFLSEFWQKKPLLIRNALPDVSSPVAADVLAGLACEEEVESRIVIQDQSNNGWELKHGPFTEESFSSLPSTHWTLLVQAVDHWMPQAAKFLESFSFIPRWRIDDLMMSYSSDGGGVGPHYDNYDVFLVQTDGKRKWEVGEQYNENSPLIENLPVSILSDFKAIDSWVLEPGDILYVPPGFGHNGIALGNDCVTCSVGFRAPSHSEILREYTDHVSEDISEALRYEDADLIVQTNSGEISKQALERLQKILHQYLEDENSVNDWFGRYMTTPKYSQSNDSSNNLYKLEDVTNHLAADGRLIRNEGSRYAFITKQNINDLYVDGEYISGSIDTNPLIEALCSEIELTKEMYSQTDDNMTLLLELLQRGALYLPEA